MVEPDDRSFDDELRRRAQRSNEDAVARLDVDADLEVVRTRISSPPAPVDRPFDQRLVWLSAAAVVALVAGVVAIVAARDDGETIRSAATSPSLVATSTSIASTTIAPATPVGSVVTSTTTPATTSAPSTTVADEQAPPPITTVLPTSTVAPTSSVAPATTVPVDDCWREPVPPPSLADGSPVGEAVVTDADKGLGTTTYTWGEGDVAVTQVVGSPVAPIGEDLEWASVTSGDWTGVAESQMEPPLYEIRLHDGSSDCTLAYGIDGTALDLFDAGVVAHAWVEFLGGGVPIPDGRHLAAPSPVPYLAWTRVSADDGSGDPIWEVHRFDRDGTDLGPYEIDDLDVLVDWPVDAGWNRRLGLVGGPRYEPCPGVQPTAIGLGEPISVDERILDSPASSIAGVATGYVVVSRVVCPDGAIWGDPGTAVELVRFHVDDPEIEPLVFARFEPEVDEFGFQRGRWRAETVAPDGRYVGAAESTSVETVGFAVFDMLRADASSAEPLVLPSGCADDGRFLVAPPAFVGDGVAVLAHGCGPNFGLVVDVVALDQRSLLWSQEVVGGTSQSYGGRLAGLSAVAVDGEVWVLVQSGDPTAGTADLRLRTVLLDATSQTEITRLRPTSGYAFTIADLIANR